MYCWPGDLIGQFSVGAAVLTSVSGTVFTFNVDDKAVVEALAHKAVVRDDEEEVTLENEQKVEISAVGVGAVASGGRLYPQAVKSIVNGTASPVTSKRMHALMVTYLSHGGSMAAVLEKAGVEKNDEGMRKLS